MISKQPIPIMINSAILTKYQNNFHNSGDKGSAPLPLHQNSMISQSKDQRADKLRLSIHLETTTKLLSENDRGI